jgi:hypothetical protein
VQCAGILPPPRGSSLAILGNLPGKISAFGTKLNPAVAIGMACAAGDLMSQSIGDSLKTLPQLQGLDITEQRLLAPMVTAVSTLVAVNVFVGKTPDPVTMSKVVALGAVSAMSGDYLYGTIYQYL